MTSMCLFSRAVCNRYTRERACVSLPAWMHVYYALLRVFVNRTHKHKIKEIMIIQYGGPWNFHIPQSQPADLCPLSPCEERRSRLWSPPHLVCLPHIHVNRFNTRLKIARCWYLGGVEAKTLYFELFSSSTSQRVPYWLSRKAQRERLRKGCTRQAGGELLLVWSAHSL